MLSYVIPLIACMSPLWGYILNYVFVLGFIASVPCIIREVFR